MTTRSMLGLRIPAPVLVGVAGLALLAPGSSKAASSDADNGRIMTEIRAAIVRDYVEPSRLGNDSFASPQDLLGALDPHSSYIAPAAWKEMQVPLAPGFGSVGLGLTRNEGRVQVFRVLAGSPADRAGVRLGDDLVAVDGDPVGQKPIEAVIAVLRGKSGDPVALSLLRGGDARIELTLVREPPRVLSVDTRTIGDIQYLRVSTLNGSTTADVGATIASARRQASKGLIIDLRDCPGGLLDAAIGVTDLFLNGGEIASERGRAPRDVMHFSTRHKDRTNGLPIVVLINQGTASGCELIAAALQDHHRARLVGLPTFGEGSVQTVIPLQAGADGAIRLTTAFLYRASGAPIQKHGVQPELLVAASQAQADAWAAHKIFSEASFKNALDAGPAVDIGAAAQHPAAAPLPGYAGDYQLDAAKDSLAALDFAKPDHLH